MSTATLLTDTFRTHDPHGAGHAERVTGMALLLAEELRAGDSRIKAIRIGGPLHDIGKLAVPQSILQKPGPLDPEELEEIRAHPIVGIRILDGVEGARDGLDCVLHHHEWWNGRGYPHGLRGHEIPFEARILAVADAYDAMISHRPYRRALTHEEAIAEVERCAGTQFDPQVAEAFLLVA
jgi:HD-GYP domain-containing protein (c-di-GMP phosphodiesterase class II)